MILSHLKKICLFVIIANLYLLYSLNIQKDKLNISLNKSNEIILNHYQSQITPINRYLAKFKKYEHLIDNDFKLTIPKNSQDEKFAIQSLNSFCSLMYKIDIDHKETLSSQIHNNLKEIHNRISEFKYERSIKKHPIEIIISSVDENQEAIELEINTINSFVKDSCLIRTKSNEIVAEKLPFESKIELNKLKRPNK